LVRGEKRKKKVDEIMRAKPKNDKEEINAQ
jgi:hypothetical protein